MSGILTPEGYAAANRAAREKLGLEPTWYRCELEVFLAEQRRHEAGLHSRRPGCGSCYRPPSDLVVGGPQRPGRGIYFR